jgi:threonine dehydratase
MAESALVSLAREVAEGFAVTPFSAIDLGLPAPIWVKDETGNVAGSHKGRHLVGILLHLRAAEMLGLATGRRPPLLAAATLARRVEWPLEVFVPEWAADAVLSTIESLGAGIVVCDRRDDDPPGDPSLLRFREAVRGGALPFTVQGPENALCLDGGRTLGWEMADSVGSAAGPASLDRAVVQVGGGALAACVGWALGPGVRLDTVQAQGCAPLARAWWRAMDAGYADTQLPSRWEQLMTPWQSPSSIADGILDDETYDWLGDFAVMKASGGRPIVVPEEAIGEAFRIARGTGVDVSPTGAAGVAGLLVGDGRPASGERVAVIFSGVGRDGTT